MSRQVELKGSERLFGVAMPKVFQVENTADDQNNTTQDKEVNQVVRHLFGMPVAEVFEVNESHPDQAKDNKDEIQRRQLIHNLSGMTTGLAALVYEKSCYANDQNDRSSEKEPPHFCNHRLGILLLRLSGIYDNPCDKEKQCENKAQRCVKENERFSGNHSKDENGEGNLTAVKHEFCRILTGTRVHRVNRISNSREV